MKPVPFKDAIASAKARKVVLPDIYYGALQGDARARAFSVVTAATVGQLQEVLDSLTRELEAGGSLQTWRGKVEDGLVPLELPRYRLDNIFRTNVQGAYAAGRYKAQVDSADLRPFLMYDAINDSRTRPAHAALDNAIFPIGDPFWTTHYPPNGYQCRCGTTSLTESQAKARAGPTLNYPTVQGPDGHPTAAMPDDGWDYNPGAAPWQGIDKALADTLARANPSLVSVAKHLAPPEAPWVTLNDSTIMRAKVKELGAARYKELVEDFVIPDDRALVPRMSLRGRKLGEVLAEPSGIDPDELAKIIPRMRDGILEELERRQGISKISATTRASTNAFDVEGAKIIKEASLRYPDSWVSRGNELCVTEGRDLRVYFSEKRGHYQKEATHPMGGPEIYIRTPEGSTAVHEYGHHLQRALGGAQSVFLEEHRARTAGHAVEELYPNRPDLSDEVGRPDGYYDRYQGKEYAPYALPLEMFTMAFQPILGDDSVPGLRYGGRAGDAELYFARMIKRDPEMLKLSLGLLFHYVP